MTVPPGLPEGSEYFPEEPFPVEPDGRRAKKIMQYEAEDRGSRNPVLKLKNFGIVKDTINPEPFQQEAPSSSYYDMSARRHGTAFIINNKEFERHSTRGGTDRDEYNLH